MSKVGKAPIEIPEEVELELEDGTVTARGENGLEVYSGVRPGFRHCRDRRR